MARADVHREDTDGICPLERLFTVGEPQRMGMRMGRGEAPGSAPTPLGSDLLQCGNVSSEGVARSPN